MFEKLKHRRPHNDGRGFRALIVTPTRDMATSIFERADRFFSSTDIVLVLLDGGESELERLGHQKPDVVIVTLDTLIQQLSAAADDGIMSLRTVELLVIDGAYEMLRLGFDHHLKQILGLSQVGELVRQTLLFTTVLTAEVRALAKKFLRPHLLGIPVQRYDMMLEKISSLALGGQEQPCVGLGQPNNLQGPCPPPAPPSHSSDAKKKKKRSTHDGMEEGGRLKKRAEKSMDED